jgi:RecA-family ATPase
LLKILLADDRTMLVIDPMRNVHGADENDSNAMSPMFNDFRRWTNVYGITIVLLHHTPKLNEDADMNRIASWFRGSTALAAILDTAQYVNRFSKTQIKVLRQGRFPPLDPLTISDLGGSKLNDDKGFSI